jgi:nucleotide-binding universal stress UspA family protein
MSANAFETPDTQVIVAAVEGTSADAHIVEVAAKAAKNEARAELHIVHVLGAARREPTGVGPVFPEFTELMEDGRKLLDQLIEGATAHFSGRIVGHLAVGEPWREIVQMASHLRADMIVVGTADRTGLPRLFLGSVAARVVRKAQCPVLVARRTDYHSRVVPEIEPPCPDCLVTQRETNREKLWCARHATAHTHGRLHYESPQSYGAGSMLVRP